MEGVEDALDMVAPAGLDDQLDLDVLGGEHGERALVVHFIDVGARFADDPGDPRERARHVARAHPDARQPSGPHHAALDDGREQQRVDVAAAQHQPDRGGPGSARAP